MKKAVGRLRQLEIPRLKVIDCSKEKFGYVGIGLQVAGDEETNLWRISRSGNISRSAARVATFTPTMLKESGDALN